MCMCNVGNENDLSLHLMFEFDLYYEKGSHPLQ
jgi:hypothetical protein